MLVLTRKTQEGIQIADDIRLIVLEIRGGRVKLGVSAPSDVEIRRSEIPARQNKFSLKVFQQMR